jgi:diguanylate cyclase (GGDEF)-like protein
VGGVRFLLLLPEANIEGAVQHDNKICELIFAKRIVYEGQKIRRTMSFWVSAYSEDTNTKKTINQADQRLYIAKNSGRKKVVWKYA